MRVAAVFAHPDDIELGCGGTLALHTRNGDEVYAITLTSGDIGGDAHVREQEGSAGLHLLGIKHVEFWRQPDGHLQVSPGLIGRLREFLTANDIDVVYTNYEADAHQDHRSTNLIVVSAVRRFPISLYLCELPSTRDFVPNVYVDISATFEQKCQSLRHHESQLSRESFTMDDVKVLAKYRSRWAGLELAEAFSLYRLVTKSKEAPLSLKDFMVSVSDDPVEVSAGKR